MCQIRLSSCTIHVLQNIVPPKIWIIRRSAELIVKIDYVIRNLLYTDATHDLVPHSSRALPGTWMNTAPNGLWHLYRTVTHHVISIYHQIQVCWYLHVDHARAWFLFVHLSSVVAASCESLDTITKTRLLAMKLHSQQSSDKFVSAHFSPYAIQRPPSYNYEEKLFRS